MKALITYLLILTGILLSGCKNNQQQDAQGDNMLTGSIDIILNVVAREDDTFALFYTLDGSADFSKIGPLLIEVKGSDQLQRLVYKLPKGVLKPQIRLDFGNNKRQKDILLKDFQAVYNDRSIHATGTEIYRLFRPDLTKCTLDRETGLIKAIVTNGVRQSPSLYPHEKFFRYKMGELTNTN